MYGDVDHKRKIINRKQLALQLENELDGKSGEACKVILLSCLKKALKTGTQVVQNRLESGLIDGLTAAQALSYLMDQLIRTLYDATTMHVFPLGNPTEAERLALVATGGFGRATLAPHSDIDLLFLHPYKPTAWAESVVEYMLYILWDMGLKVGHATRSADDCIRVSAKDLSVKTSLLDARYIWGDQSLYTKLTARFHKKLVAGRGTEFVEAKLAERNQRHLRMGDSRYVVEPNIKEGKGGLRDLHTLFWIGRFLFGVKEISGLYEQGFLTRDELRRFVKSERFLWTVRCYLHFLTGRAEERITFDVQKELAERLRYHDHPGLSGVERFMKHYFLVAKQVGDLTRVFCASLEARQYKKRLLRFSRFAPKRKVDDFRLDGDRLTLLHEDDFETDPVKLIRIFWVAEKHGYDIHPDVLRLIIRSLSRIDNALRTNSDANRLFLEVLTSPKTPEIALRRMNESGVLGRFIPDFGRIVAQMQHDMYHHYTVDEHSIRAIGLLSRIEKNELVDEHPLVSKIIESVSSRRALYVSVFLHDIAKGRGGDHSRIGADIARRLCPRLGMTPSETDLTAWLVRYHLLMSHFAFKRDLSDSQTIEDFAKIVKSHERLKLLISLTVVDIRAVGPGIWNGWKGQLLRELYQAAEQRLMAGHMAVGWKERVLESQEKLKSRLQEMPPHEVEKLLAIMPSAYWIAENTELQEDNARLILAVQKSGKSYGAAINSDPEHSITRVSIFAEDMPGLFAKLSGVLALAGANILDAKIFTTSDGFALDNFSIQERDGSAFDDQKKLARLNRLLKDAFERKIDIDLLLARKPMIPSRRDIFTVEPLIIFDNKASSRHTVLEISARDRIGLLHDLTKLLYEEHISIFSAHVATYGERAVDVFYIHDAEGKKITSKRKLQSLDNKLAKVASTGPVYLTKETQKSLNESPTSRK